MNCKDMLHDVWILFHDELDSMPLHATRDVRNRELSRALRNAILTAGRERRMSSVDLDFLPPPGRDVWPWS